MAYLDECEGKGSSCLFSMEHLLLSALSSVNHVIVFSLPFCARPL